MLMMPLLALAAAGLLADSKLPRAPAPAHRASANVAAYFGADDYPADALLSGTQGIVGFLMDVDATGRVSACRITKSSGSPVLDGATCRIARDRVLFDPARDRRGRPVPDHVATRVRWVLPDPDPPIRARANLASYISDADYPAAAIRAGEQGIVGFQLQVAPDGAVSTCRVTASSNSGSLDEATCRIMTTRARFTPARDAAGNAVADRISSRIRWVLPVQEADSSDAVELTAYFSSADYPAEAIRRRMEGRVDVELAISPGGRVLQCQVTRPSGSFPLDARSCEIIQARARFVPAVDAAGQPVSDVVAGFVQWTLPPP